MPIVCTVLEIVKSRYSCASAQSFSVCVGVVWGLYWVARYFTGVVDHVGRLSNKYSYRRNLVFNVGRYMHVCVGILLLRLCPSVWQVESLNITCIIVVVYIVCFQFLRLL